MEVDECQIALMQYKLEIKNQETNLAKKTERKAEKKKKRAQGITLKPRYCHH